MHARFLYDAARYTPKQDSQALDLVLERMCSAFKGDVARQARKDLCYVGVEANELHRPRLAEQGACYQRE